MAILAGSPIRNALRAAPRLHRCHLPGIASSMMLFMEDTTVREDADITIVGLGPGAFEQLSVGAWEALRQARLRFLRTAIHPTVQELTARGIRFVTFDELYDKNPDFESLYRQIAERVIAAASQGPVTYAVPGHPLVAEESVRLIMLEAERQGLIAAVVPSMSALDAIFAAARQDPVAGLQVFDALAFEPNEWIPPAAQPSFFSFIIVLWLRSLSWRFWSGWNRPLSSL